MTHYDICFTRGMIDTSQGKECPYTHGSKAWHAWMDGMIQYLSPEIQEEAMK
jgi:hypothetical protein